MEIIEKNDIYKPKLAARVVALIHPATNAPSELKNIQTWTDRNLLDWEPARVKPGKNNPRLYSLSDVIRLKTMSVLTEYSAMTVKQANAVSKMAVDRFIERYDMGDRSFDDCEIPHKNLLVAQNKYKEAMDAYLLTNEEISANLNKTGLMTGGKPLGLTHSFLPVDYMLMSIWNSFSEIDEEFNQMALDGKLKPFPKSL